MNRRLDNERKVENEIHVEVVKSVEVSIALPLSALKSKNLPRCSTPHNVPFSLLPNNEKRFQIK